MLRRMWAAAAVVAGTLAGGSAVAGDEVVKLGRYQPNPGGFAGAVKSAATADDKADPADDTELVRGGGHGGGFGGHGGHFGGYGGHYGGFGGYRGFGYGGYGGYRGFGYGGYGGYRGYGYGGYGYGGYRGYGYGGYGGYRGFGYGGYGNYYRPYYGYGGFSSGFLLGSLFSPYYSGYGGYGGYFGNGYGGYYSSNYGGSGYNPVTYYASAPVVTSPVAGYNPTIAVAFAAPANLTLTSTQKASTGAPRPVSVSGVTSGALQYDGGPAASVPQPTPDRPAAPPQKIDPVQDVDSLSISLPAAKKPAYKYPAYGDKK